MKRLLKIQVHSSVIRNLEFYGQSHNRPVRLLVQPGPFHFSLLGSQSRPVQSREIPRNSRYSSIQDTPKVPDFALHSDLCRSPICTPGTQRPDQQAATPHDTSHSRNTVSSMV